MSIDTKTAGRVAKLARIKVEEVDLPALAQEFTNILGFIEQLNEVVVEGVEPMISVSSTAVVSPARRASRAPASVSFIKSDIIPPPSAQQKIPHAHRAHWRAQPLADRHRSQHRPGGKAVAA